MKEYSSNAPISIDANTLKKMLENGFEFISKIPFINHDQMLSNKRCRDNIT